MNRDGSELTFFDKLLDITGEVTGKVSLTIQAFFKWAKQHSPDAVVLAVGSLALFVVAYWALKTGISLIQLLTASLVVIIVGAFGIVLSRLVQSKAPRYLSESFSWTVALLFTVFNVLVLISAISNIFPQGTLILSRILQTTDLIRPNAQRILRVTSTLQISALGELLDVDSGSNLIDKAKILADRGKLVIEPGGRLILGPAEKQTIAVHTLILNGGEIVTNGGELGIEAVDIISANGSRIVSFAPSISPPNDQPGRSAKQVQLNVLGHIHGSLIVDLSGSVGGNGSDGAPGQPGSRGGDGENAASGVFDCRSGPGRGHAGGRGQDGWPGQPGQRGGDGGTLVTTARHPEDVLSTLRFESNGGAGGTGGRGGAGGPGGPGGDGGYGRGLCQGSGPRGPDGIPGYPGVSGVSGPTGNPGKLVIAKLEE